MPLKRHFKFQHCSRGSRTNTGPAIALSNVVKPTVTDSKQNYNFANDLDEYYRTFPDYSRFSLTFLKMAQFPGFEGFPGSV